MNSNVSHDDHTAEKLQWALDLGVSVAEFPVTLEAVDFARAHGMATVFGTPNLLSNINPNAVTPKGAGQLIN